MFRISLNNLLLFVYFFLHLSFSLFIRFHCFCKRKKSVLFFVLTFYMLFVFAIAHRKLSLSTLYAVCAVMISIHRIFIMFKICPFSQSFASISTAKVVRCRRNFSFFILIFLTKKKVQTNININVFGFFL